jgi:hypothetical protein
MRFYSDGVSYETADMIALDVPDPYAHGVYVTRDGACVFVVRITRDGVVVSRVRGAELHDYARRFPLPELIAAAEADDRGAPCGGTPDRPGTATA